MPRRKIKNKTGEEITTSEFTERIYKNKIAELIFKETKEASEQKYFHKPDDTVAMRLAIQYCANWLHKHHLNISLDAVNAETHGLFKPERQKTETIARTLYLDVRQPIVTQFLNNHDLFQRSVSSESSSQRRRGFVQSSDGSEFSDQSAAEDAAKEAKYNARKRTLKNKTQRIFKELEADDTFTEEEDIESRRRRPRLWEASYGLAEGKLHELKKKNERKNKKRNVNVYKFNKDKNVDTAKNRPSVADYSYHQSSGNSYSRSSRRSDYYSYTYSYSSSEIDSSEGSYIVSKMIKSNKTLDDLKIQFKMNEVVPREPSSPFIAKYDKKWNSIVKK